MQEMHLHRDDLEKILRFVDEINPADTTRLGAGMVKITCDNSSGIGSIVTATVCAKIGENYGDFTINVVDESSW